jgi:hypothetical protein
VRFSTALTLAGSILATSAFAQQQPIAYVPVEGVSVSGSLAVANGKASIGNDGTIRAGDSTAHVQLARGGELRLCASTTVHLSRDSSLNATDSALMIALDRGAIEASYKPGKYSDVLLTPDLRILVSGPGQADLKVRTNQKGDTCIDNHGPNAPYVTVTSQFEGGLYRVQPNQRVMFEHGSLNQVVDNEPEPCGCPAATPSVSVANAAPGILPNTDTAAPTAAPAAAPTAAPTAGPTASPAKPAQPTGGRSSTPADTAFPLAESEGLKPPPPPPTQPVVPVGTPHAEVQVPITYDAKATPNPTAPGAAGPPPPETSPADAAPPPAENPTPAPAAPKPQDQSAAQQPAKQKSGGGGGLFHSIGRFFAHLFGRP